ncbi:MAG: WG repeat-containing protein [Flavobacteriales bacterium]|nr:WG repeat-containing protein [Flavobacteriales bacterium]MCB9196137.1 WG repeat-containing protein [Flavobacteriales bacterium]
MVLLTQAIYGQVYPVPNGWINVSGEVISLESDSTFYSESDFVRYIKDGKYYFTKLSALSFSSASYEELSDFDNGYAVARTEGKWWVIDTSDKKIKQLNCHFAYGFQEGLARIQLGNRFGYVNTKGEVAISVKYYGAYDFSEGRARVYYKGKWGAIDNQGKFVVKPVYDYMWDFTEGIACVMKQENTDQRWGYIDLNGNKLIDTKFGYAFPFSNGLGLVRWGDLYTNDIRFIDRSGDVKFKIPYKDIFPYSDDLACFFENGKWGYLDMEFQVVLPAIYDRPADFINGIAGVFLEGQLIYIDKSGKTIWER